MTKRQVAMIQFCEANAGEICYVPRFNDDGECTVMAATRKRLEERKAKRGICEHDWKADISGGETCTKCGAYDSCLY